MHIPNPNPNPNTKQNNAMNPPTQPTYNTDSHHEHEIPIENLNDLNEPLVEALNAHCTASGGYFGISHGYLFGPDVDPDEECLIDAGINYDEGAHRAVAMLLRASASQDRVDGYGLPEFRAMWSPLHYSFIKRVYGFGPQDNLLYLYCQPHAYDRFTWEAAKQQVAALVAYLGDPKNILELTPEERARL